MADLVQRLATDWKVRDRKPLGQCLPLPVVQPWGPPSLLSHRYWVYYPRVKQPGRGVNHPSACSTEVIGGVEMYISYASVLS
jgi:hypothetical protein